MLKATILVIDDDRQVCGYMKTILELAGYFVQTVLNAEDAELLLVNRHFDMILLDYGLPGKNGAEFLRTAVIPRSTKVILITSKLSREMLKAMFDLGICGYVEKPIDNDELTRHVAFHLHRKMVQMDASIENTFLPMTS